VFCRHNLRVDFQRVIPEVSVYFVIDSVRKLLDIPSYYKSKFLRGNEYSIYKADVFIL